MFNSNVSLIWNFYKDGVFYLNHINDFYIYEFGFENVQSILEEDYIKRKEEDYKIVQINNTSLNIIDNHTGSSKKVLINDLKQNDTISKLSGGGLFSASGVWKVGPGAKNTFGSKIARVCARFVSSWIPNKIFEEVFDV